jgi:PPOX class probable F420-dependent enzyme
MKVYHRSGVGLLTTYRRTGEPVATPVSIAVSDEGLFFVSSTTSGKARRLQGRADVTLAPSTVAGRPTGPASSGQAHLLDEAGRRRVRRLLQPGGPLFWSYLLYRIRGHRLNLYEVRLAEPVLAEPVTGSASPTKIAQLYRAVHRTARVSALLFAGAQATSARGITAGPASRRLYLAFMSAHAVHFAVVARYAKANGGRDLFPGGRSMQEVGGWPRVLSIYGFFAILALLGWVAGPPRASGRHPVSALGNAATGLIAALFVGTYLGQLPRSPWYALGATTVVGAVTANFLAQRRGEQLRTDLT